MLAIKPLISQERSISVPVGTATVKPTDTSVLGFVTNIDGAGNVSKSQVFGSQVQPVEDVLTVLPPFPTSNPHTVPDNTPGTITAVRIVSSPTGGWTIYWPNSRNYSSGETITLIDPYGQVTTDNPVTVLTSNNQDLFSGQTQYVFNETSGKKEFTSDGAGNWSVPPNKTSIQPFSPFSQGPYLQIPGGTSIGKHNAHFKLVTRVKLSFDPLSV